AGYALFFPQNGTSDYVIKHGMPSLTAVTVCFWVKTADTGNAGTLLSYAISGEDNELLLYDYRKLVLWVGGKSRYKHFLAT
ncbi:Sushi, von Willebrand factor type A, EGF and pentraxin domain containing 1, partial [Desmophyllum pertusum]